jgi:hypothetical protein
VPVGRIRVATVPGRRALALRFLAGRYQGGVYPLEPGREVLIGRQTSCDVVLAEEEVSRRHARLGWEGESPLIEDLGSTNGTYVNGERVKGRKLAEGDRILVGATILKLVRELRPVPALPAEPTVESPVETLDPMRGSSMRGLIQEVGLPDLLQLLGASRKTGLLAVRSARRSGGIHLDQGVLGPVQIAGLPGLSPRKALLRLLSWTDGEFELGPSPGRPPGPGLDEPVEAALMEAMRQRDELERLRAELPAAARLTMGKPPAGAMDRLEPHELELVDAALHADSVEELLDQTPVDDVEATRLLAALVKEGVLRRA